MLTGCGSDEPSVVVDPNEYAPYQASPDEIAQQQAEELDNMSPEAVSSSDQTEVVVGIDENTPQYFPVSEGKLITLYILSFGLYGVYWFYKNWTLLQPRMRRYRQERSTPEL